jgi:hypothetical protein
MYYAEYTNSNEEDETSKKLKKEYEYNNNYLISEDYAEYNKTNEEDELSKKIKKEYNKTNEEDELSKKFIKEYEYNNYLINEDKNIQPLYNDYYKPQTGFCDMSFGGLIKNKKTNTIVIPVNADLEYDNDCKMGYNTTLLIPVTVPMITKESPVVIIPVITQQKVDNNNKNIVSTSTQQPILEAKLENNKISVKPIDNITNVSKNAQIVTAVTNVNESKDKIEATTITSLPIKLEENKKVVTESNFISTDISGSNTKTDTNITISQTCLNGKLQCDVKQKINSIKSDLSDLSNNYVAYLQSTRTVVDLSSGEIGLYGKNEVDRISTIPTKFASNNTDISKNIMLVKDDKTLKVEIPSNATTVVKVNKKGEVMNTTTQPIKINTKDPCTVETCIERFTVDNIEGYSVTSVLENYTNGTTDSIPNINIPVYTTN